MCVSFIGFQEVGRNDVNSGELKLFIKEPSNASDMDRIQ